MYLKILFYREGFSKIKQNVRRNYLKYAEHHLRIYLSKGYLECRGSLKHLTAGEI